jgi:hypothetical protein
VGIAVGIEDSLAGKSGVLFPHLDERQRRLAAGAEAGALGHGGIRVVAGAAGMREGTVCGGVAELEPEQAPLGRVGRVAAASGLVVSVLVLCPRCWHWRAGYAR